MSEFRLSREADTNLDDIADYFERHDPPASVKVLESLLDTLQFLADHPGAGDQRDVLGQGCECSRDKSRRATTLSDSSGREVVLKLPL